MHRSIGVPLPKQLIFNDKKTYFTFFNRHFFRFVLKQMTEFQQAGNVSVIFRCSI